MHSSYLYPVGFQYFTEYKCEFHGVIVCLLLESKLECLISDNLVSHVLVSNDNFHESFTEDFLSLAEINISGVNHNFNYQKPIIFIDFVLIQFKLHSKFGGHLSQF